MNVWGITHRGMVREQNQDAFACRTLPDGRIIALVCDGMGGARAGNIASTMAVELFMEEFLSRKEDESDRVRMERAASRANDEVFHRSNVDMECSGMGTTLVAALAGPHETVILNEGDSRAYHVTPEGITRVTRDHSLVEDLVERGDLTRDQARVHPHKNHPRLGGGVPSSGGLFLSSGPARPLPAAVQRRLEQCSDRPGVAL